MFDDRFTFQLNSHHQGFDMVSVGESQFEVRVHPSEGSLFPDRTTILEPAAILQAFAGRYV